MTIGTRGFAPAAYKIRLTAWLPWTRNVTAWEGFCLKQGNGSTMDVAWIPPTFRRTAPVLAAASLAMAGTLLHSYRRLPPPEPGMAACQPPAWTPVERALLEFNGASFKSSAVPSDPSSSGLLARRFRLAGTFSADDGRQRLQQAILDDLEARTQILIAEGESLEGGIRVAQVGADFVRLDLGASAETLWLSYTDADGTNRAAAAGTGPGMEASLASRFGKRTGERRWLMEREALLRYYQELLEQPNRLAKVFESLKPVYQSGKIAGYTLDAVGEADFFAAMGLAQGDVIRRLNSMPMVSQSRAEYFIHEFVKNKVNAFVLDIERDAKPQQLIYLVR